MGNSSSPSPDTKPDYPDDQYDSSDDHGRSEGGGLFSWLTDSFGPSTDPTWGPSSPPSKGDDSGDF